MGGKATALRGAFCLLRDAPAILCIFSNMEILLDIAITILGFSIIFFIILLFIALPVVTAISLILLRCKIRADHMHSLAREFNLSFRTQVPSVRDILLRRHKELSHLEGTVGQHTVNISDHYRPQWFIVHFLRHTVIQIDNEYLRGKGPYETFKLRDAYLTPLITLRKILRRLD